MITPLKSSHLRWWICLIIFVATAIIYSDRQFLSLLKSALANEIHWSDFEFAKVNACFLGAYAFGLLFMGRFIDRVGVKIGYATTVLLWSIAALSHTLVTTVQGFMFARIFLGLSEAGNFPSAIKTVAQWFPQSERAFATALFNSGANVGPILAPFLVAWLLRVSSWHAPFIFVACIGFVWVGFWWLFYAPPEKHQLVSPSELALIQRDPISPQENGPAISWFSLFTYPQSWSFIIPKFLTDPVWFFLLFWLPDYFKKTRHLDIQSSWPHLMSIYAIVTVFSLIGSYIPGILTRRGWNITRARKTGLFCYALLMLPILTVGIAGDRTAVILIGLAGAAHQAWSSNLFTTVSDMFPRHTIGAIIGMGSMAGAIGSMLFQYFCGHILDIYGADHASIAYFILFTYAAFAYLVSFGIQHLFAPRFEPLKIHPH